MNHGLKNGLPGKHFIVDGQAIHTTGRRDFTHNLGPIGWCEVKLLCVDGDLGHAPGDEIEARCVVFSATDGDMYQVSVNGTQVSITTNGGAAGRIMPKDGGGYSALTPAKWRFKIYLGV